MAHTPDSILKQLCSAFVSAKNTTAYYMQKNASEWKCLRFKMRVSETGREGVREWEWEIEIEIKQQRSKSKPSRVYFHVWWAFGIFLFKQPTKHSSISFLFSWNVFDKNLCIILSCMVCLRKHRATTNLFHEDLIRGCMCVWEWNDLNGRQVIETAV